MGKLRKIAKIKGFESKELKELLESIENKGFQVLWDDKRTGSERTWKIYKTIKTNETFDSLGFETPFVTNKLLTGYEPYPLPHCG